MNTESSGMRIFDRDNNNADATERVIASGTALVGDIAFSGQLRVDGELRGDVSALDGQSATLIIGEKGRVSGNIEVTHLVIHGSVAGHVCATNLVELHSKSKVNCDLEYFGIEMHPGAVVQGRLMHLERVVPIGVARSNKFAVPARRVAAL